MEIDYVFAERLIKGILFASALYLSAVWIQMGIIARISTAIRNIDYKYSGQSVQLGGAAILWAALYVMNI